MSFHFPGDLLDLNGLLLGKHDHSIGTLTRVEAAPIPHATVLGWIEQHPGLGRLLWQDTLVDAAVFREWVVNIGRRSAYARTAHLLCELAARLQAARMAQEGDISLPLTAADLADATGLSIVHVNRVLQELRARKLVEPRDGLTVLDLEGLRRAADFDPDYLHQRATPAAA